MRKKLGKIKWYWVIYIRNANPINNALSLAWKVFRLHRRAGFKKSLKIAQGYFKLGLVWGGFKMPGSPSG